MAAACLGLGCSDPSKVGGISDAATDSAFDTPPEADAMADVPADAGLDSPESAGDAGPSHDAAIDATGAPLDSGPPADARVDALGSSSADAAPSVVGISIVSLSGDAMAAPVGEAVPLGVRLSMSDGTSRIAASESVTWTLPLTVVAGDPDDAGTNVVPEAGATPTAFFVDNIFREERPNVLYVIDRGTVPDASVSIRARVLDAGEVSASLSVLAPPFGDAASGAYLFQHALSCTACHGLTGGGSPLAYYPDGGQLFLDGAVAYVVGGQQYTFPAPGLNNAPDSGNLAADPSWTAALFSMAAQSAIDNRGIALRFPMVEWQGGTNATGGTLSAQDFADIYAWLQTQTE